MPKKLHNRTAQAVQKHVCTGNGQGYSQIGLEQRLHKLMKLCRRHFQRSHVWFERIILVLFSG
eukprot:scaffold88721_cov17-Prasinocladus_malaysianus.AAC.1